MSVKFPKCDDDVKIVHLGKVLIPKNSKEFRPSIEVWCYPPQKSNNFHTSAFSNMPILFRNNIINKNRLAETYANTGNHLFTLNDSLEEGTLDVFPELSKADSVRNKEAEVNAFILHRKNKPTLVIPQLELARVLFFSSSYLSRASLMSTRILTDFSVDLQNNIANIEVIKTSNFPLSAFDQSSTRQIISWLLLNKNARESFSSIFMHFNLEVSDAINYKTWHFKFDPPEMNNWKIFYNGRLDSSGKYFLIEKIYDVEIDAQMPSEVYFHNPKFTHIDDQLSPSQGGGKSTLYEPPEDHHIDDDQTASNKNKVVLIGELNHCLRFKKQFSSSKSTLAKRSNNPQHSDSEAKLASDVVSTGEPNSTGTVPVADLSGTQQDSSDKTKEYAARFTAFTLMVNVLNKHYGCEIVEKITHELDQVGRSKCHLIGENKKRAIMSVLIKKEGRLNYLLEVDTTGLNKWLSTKCIKVSSPKGWHYCFSSIKTGLVQKSLAWPTKVLNDRFGDAKHIGISHPKAGSEHTTEISLESINEWAKRVMSFL